MGASELNAVSGGLFSLIYASGPVAKGVVVILLFFSVVAWTIILYKWTQLKAVEKDGRKFLRMAKDADSFKRLTSLYADNPDSPFYKLLLTAYKESSARHREGGITQETLAAIDNLLKVTVAEESARLDSKLSWLASTANTAPFIGLFGTVYGIIDAFREIGVRGSTSLAVVAPGISEALITTALGLATAIPAVLGYNWLTNKSRSISSGMENASAYIINLLSR
jgi:biopolymer transport protein TolQ